MEDDWDLYAVVRSCCATNTTSSTSSTAAATTTTTTTNSSCSTRDAFHHYSSFKTEQQQQQENDHFLYFPDLYESRNNNIEELHDLFRPKLRPASSPQPIPISPLSVLGGLPDLSQPPQQEKQKQVQVGPRSTFTTAAATRHNSQNPRSKRRKNQMKRVCQVPAEGLSSDMWSWRKYGQKPIKGSPYPRGYYRCSTSKGCLARKQVERNRSDPNMFIVTYTGDHNHPIPTHRNSLAGSTRQKLVTSPTITEGDPNKPTCSTPISPAASLSPGTEKIEVEEEDDEFGTSDMALSDDFFMGLEEIASPISGDGFSDHFPFSWSANNATTTAAGGV